MSAPAAVAALAQSTSTASLALTCSAHSADDNTSDLGPEDLETLEQGVHSGPRIHSGARVSFSEANIHGGGGSGRAPFREVAQPYIERADVGAIGFLTGNWGGGRKNKKLQAHCDGDLKKTPACILLLQEAQMELCDVLRSPAVAGDPTAEADLDRRSSKCFLLLRPLDAGNTLLIAGDQNVVSEIRSLKWNKLMDGPYKDKKTGARRVAYTRFQIAEVAFKYEVCTWSAMVVANVHLHPLTAKKETGFATAHAYFWRYLAENIIRYGIRVLAGDFNMALWCVVPELRRRGIRVDIAAWFPWRCTSEGVFEDVTKCDSEGIFVIGGARSIKLRSSASALGLESAPFEVEEEEGPASFVAGQGYPLHSYLPKNRQEQAVRETLSLSAAVVATGPPLLPPCREKRVKTGVFDPNGNLFTMGVHMPLLVFMGDKPRRTAQALERRENKARDRGVHFGKGKGKGKGKRKDGKSPAVAGPSQGGKSSSSVVDA